MSSSFFLKKEVKSNRKRKVPGDTKVTKNISKTSSNSNKKQNAKAKAKSKAIPPTKKQRSKLLEEIASDDEIESDFEDKNNGITLEFSSDEGAEETPQDKRLRLAKQYLAEIEKQEAERTEERESGVLIEKRLRDEYLDSVGKLRRNIAANIKIDEIQNDIVLKHKLHHETLCTLALSNDGQYLFAGAKSEHVLKWHVESKKVVGHFSVSSKRDEENVATKRRSHVIAMCLTSDMKFLALAEGGKNIQIWCPSTLKHLHTFKGHRDAVTSLVFRKDTHELYSGAKDRSIKIWSLDEMAYVESLFGHQAPVTGIDALSRERALSAGGADCSLRIWKITEESQLIYNGHNDSIECVRFINDENFCSGGFDGAISVWSALKKKPLCTELIVHGKSTNGTANWITALATVFNTDLIATGSYDGYIRLWQCYTNQRKVKELTSLPVSGFINSLVFNNNGTKLYAAVGQEHRNGRWWRIKETKNRILVFNIPQIVR